MESQTSRKREKMVFIEACFGRETPYTPVWMMRQAGRYLPEYRKVREKVGDFIKMTRTPEVVAEVTLQPVEILNVDAAILFSDILNLPMEMGLPLRFEKGVGPIFDRVVDRPEELEKLDSDAPEKLEYVYRGVELIRKKLPADKALIGFAGSPWTIATYMVEGKGSKQFAKIKRLLFTNPQFIERLLQFNTDATYRYLKRQI
jgi:uroporphyrinogen decarboxylase